MAPTLQELSNLIATALGGCATKLSHSVRTFMIAGGSITVNDATYKVLVRLTDEYSTVGETFSIHLESINKVGGESFKVLSTPTWVKHRDALVDDRLYDMPIQASVSASLMRIIAIIQEHVHTMYEEGIARNQKRKTLQAKKAARDEAKLQRYTLALANELGCTEHMARQFVNDASAYVTGDKIYALARTIANRAVPQPPIVGFTIANSDGADIGKWQAWMAYFVDVDTAKAGAVEHVKFLKERGQDVVLATLHATVG
jgi:hypothetical protein